MRNHLSLWAILALLFLPYPAAIASESQDVFSYVEAILAESDPLEKTWTAEQAMQNIQRASAFGLTLPDTLQNETYGGKVVLKYDLCRSLLESQLGELRAWSLEDKHRFHHLLTTYGQLQRCINILPKEGDIPHQEALDLAKAALYESHGATEAILEEYILYSFFVYTEEYPEGTWCFFFEKPVELVRYHIGISSQGEIQFIDIPGFGMLDRYYMEITAEKKAFFTWSLKDKARFSEELFNKVLGENERGHEVLPEVQAIADYRFCLPTADAITQEEATAIAVQATQAEFGFHDHWEDAFEIYYSFFHTDTGSYCWRVVFWRSSIGDYVGGMVEMDAITGEVTLVQASGGNADTAIPYFDRL